MAHDGLRTTLESLVGPDQVVTGPGVMRYAVDGTLPELAVRPATQAETANVLAACAAAGAAIMPWGGGTDRGLGNVPRKIEVIIHLDRLNRVVELDAPNLQVTAEAGITLAALQAVVADKRQILPWDPPADHAHTLGGLVATNRSGSSRLLYGTIRDWVLGMRVALSNGDLIRSGGKVIKNVSGYDMNKLFIGSLGTLGIVTEVSLKLLPMPPVRSAVVAAFPDCAAAARVVASVLESFLLPEALDLLNPEALRLVAPRIGVDVAAGTWGLAVAVAGSQETVDRQSRDIARRFGEEGGRATPIPGGRAEAAWQAVRNVFDLLPASPAARLVCKIAVPMSRTSDLALAAEESARRHGLTLASLAHAGSGVVWAAFLMGPGAPPTEVLADVVTSLRREAEGADGSLVLYDAPPALKAQVDGWGVPGAGFEVMRRLKAEFDPRAICNPGRFLGGI